MKQILLIATGGTIASKYTKDGLSPAITAQELLTYIPAAGAFCRIETVQPFFLDSTNVGPDQWLILADLIEKKYDHYDGFVICHGTDTMAYTAAALSYLVQNSRKPVVITGAQKPIDLAVTDARTNLLDSLRFVCDERACGVNIVFGGQVIAGTRAKKERSKSYNAFSSINYPTIAVIQDDRIAFYIDDKFMITRPLKVYHKLDRRVMLHKLIPGEDGSLIDLMRSRTDAVIIESFGVGGLPNCTPAQGGTLPDAQAEGGTVCVPGEDAPVSYADAISRYIADGKQVIMATQVVHEGSDMSVYEVGKTMKSRFDLPESYDMTLEACVTKTMWALGQTKDADKFRELFYTPIGRDLLFSPLRP
jgi:L-asparaginase